MSELKPTLENPFAPGPSDRIRHYAASKPMTEIDPLAPPKAEEPPYDPGFYVSRVSQRFLEAEIEKQTLTKDELPFVYNVSLLVAKVFSRTAPSISDVEAAAKFRTQENIAKVASGEVMFDIVRREGNTMEVMPKAKRVQFWKAVAQRLLQDLTA